MVIFKKYKYILKSLMYFKFSIFANNLFFFLLLFTLKPLKQLFSISSYKHYNKQ